jgi:AraC family cel operon transcriptional repressor
MMELLRWSKIAGTDAFHAARSTRTAAQPLRYHGHDFAEIFWIDRGSGIHRINGRSEPLFPGNLIMMRPSDCHAIDAAEGEGIRLTNIAFPQETLDFLGRRYFSRQTAAFWHREKMPARQQIDAAQLRRFNRWADELSEAPRERFHLERFLLNVLAELSRDRSDARLDDVPAWLARACRTIQKPEHFSRGVEHFLRLCGRSREHASRTVRRHLGTTPTAYVNHIRMAYAMRQLEMGNREIIEIAFDCGLENLSHFYSLFRARTGMTPRAYRLAHRRLL